MIDYGDRLGRKIKYARVSALICPHNLSPSSPPKGHQPPQANGTSRTESVNQFFPHEKLDVYPRALAFAELAIAMVDSWRSTVAVRGQLDRALESIVTNIVRGAQYQRTDQGVYFLECSLGSVLECAACLDVAVLRGLIDTAQLKNGKQLLQELARMEVGLHKSWSESGRIREDEGSYSEDSQFYFSHESLSVYQRSLELHESFSSIANSDWWGKHRYAKRLDEFSTTLTLNIAEGNGRFSMRDHGKFVQIAEDAGSKLAAYMDLAAATWALDMESSKSLLREIMAMLCGLKGYLDSNTPNRQ